MDIQCRPLINHFSYKAYHCVVSNIRGESLPTLTYNIIPMVVTNYRMNRRTQPARLPLAGTKSRWKNKLRTVFIVIRFYGLVIF